MSKEIRYAVMVANTNGLIRIFWPSDVGHDVAPGVLVGWRNSELDVLIIAVMRDVEVHHLLPQEARRLHAGDRLTCAADEEGR